MQILNQSQKDWIVGLKQKGFSSRYIANVVGCSKSTVNYAVAEAQGRERKRNDLKGAAPNTSPKVLILDLETSADIVATFGRKQVNISESNIVHQGNQIISAAWKWVGQNKVHSAASKFKDFVIDEPSEVALLWKLYRALEDADEVVIHNARFDLGTIQHRMLEHGMGKIPTVKVTDTLMLARKHLKLRSNKLDSIAKYFGLSNKMQNEGITLWIATQQGDKQALESMLEYNKQDVIALEEVYKLFMPLTASLNRNLLSDTAEPVCPSCGSENISKTGKSVHTGVSSFSEYVCDDCGARSRDRTSTVPKDKRKSLLVPLQ